VTHQSTGSDDVTSINRQRLRCDNTPINRQRHTNQLAGDDDGDIKDTTINSATTITMATQQSTGSDHDTDDERSDDTTIDRCRNDDERRKEDEPKERKYQQRRAQSTAARKTSATTQQSIGVAMMTSDGYNEERKETT
jgi:hypothetical protein